MPRIDDMRESEKLLGWVDEVADRFECSCKQGLAATTTEAVEAALNDARSLLNDELAAIASQLGQRRGNQLNHNPAGIAERPPALLQPSQSGDDTTDDQPSTGNAASAGRTKTNRLPEVAGFEFFREIGRGAHGIVYLARAIALNRMVAIKMLVAGPLASEELMCRIKTEAQALAKLNHVNIVQVFDYGQSDSQPYLVCEYVPGGTLKSRTRHQPVTPRDAAKFVTLLAAAVQHAHDQNILHRDLKPANILLADANPAVEVDRIADLHARQIRLTGIPKVADFGLAKLVDSSCPGNELTRTEQILGTPEYMAPEQANRAKAVGAPADVYSLGAILYELLTGRPPFQGDDVIELLKRVEQDDPIAPVRLQVGVPVDLNTICLKCLEKAPQRRYPSASELIADLNCFLTGEPIRARKPNVLQRTARWIARNRLASALICTVLICTGTAIWAGISAGEARLSQLQTILAAETRDEVQARALISAGHLRLQSPISGRVDYVLNTLIPEIKARKDRLSDPVTVADLEYELKSLVAAADCHVDLSLASRVTLPETPNLLWNAAVHPAGHAVALATPNRPYRITRGEPFELPKGVVNTSDRSQVWYSPTGDAVAFAPHTGGLSLWDESVNRLTAQWPSTNEKGPVILAIGFLQRVADKDQEFVCVLGGDGLVRWLLRRDLVEQPKLAWRLPEGSEPPQSAAFTVDAKRLAVGDSQGFVAVFDSDGTALSRLVVDRQPVKLIAWSHDGRLVAAGMKSGAVFVYEWPSKELLHRFSPGQFEPERIFFSPDSRTLFITYLGQQTVWDVTSGDQVLTVQSGLLGCSTDGRKIASAAGSDVEFFDWHEPRVAKTIGGHGSTVYQTAWSADSTRFASIDSAWELSIWNANDGALIIRRRLPAGFWQPDNCGLALDALGQVACIAYQHGNESTAVYFLDVGSGVVSEPIELRTTGFMKVAFRKESGRFLLACDEFGHPGQWNLRTMLWEFTPDQKPGPAVVLRPAVPAEIGDFMCTLSGDGRFLLWVGPRSPTQAQRTELWDVDRRVKIESLSHPADPGNTISEPRALLSADGNHLWASWNRPVRAVIVSDLNPGLTLHREESIPKAVAPDGKWLLYEGSASSRKNGLLEEAFPPTAVEVYQGGRETPFVKIVGGISPLTLPHGTSYQFSPNRKKAVWGSKNGKLTLLDLSALRKVVGEQDRVPGR